LDAEACRSLQDLFASAGAVARVGAMPAASPAAPPRSLGDVTPAGGAVNLADLEAIAGIESKWRSNLISPAAANFLIDLRTALNKSDIQEVRDVVLFINSGYRDASAQGGAMFQMWTNHGADELRSNYGRYSGPEIEAIIAGPQTKEAVISAVARFCGSEPSCKGGKRFSAHQKALGLDLRTGHGVMTNRQAFAVYTAAEALGASVNMEPSTCWMAPSNPVGKGNLNAQLDQYERSPKKCYAEHMHIGVATSYESPEREYFAADTTRTNLAFPREIALV